MVLWLRHALELHVPLGESYRSLLPCLSAHSISLSACSPGVWWRTGSDAFDVSKSSNNGLFDLIKGSVSSDSHCSQTEKENRNSIPDQQKILGQRRHSTGHAVSLTSDLMGSGVQKKKKG